VVFAKARTDKEAWKSYKKLRTIKGVEVRNLSDNEFDFFEKWHHAVIRSLISILDFKDEYRALAKMVRPAITTGEAKESVGLLDKLGMIKKDLSMI